MKLFEALQETYLYKAHVNSVDWSISIDVNAYSHDNSPAGMEQHSYLIFFYKRPALRPYDVKVVRGFSTVKEILGSRADDQFEIVWP